MNWDTNRTMESFLSRAETDTSNWPSQTRKFLREQAPAIPPESNRLYPLRAQELNSTRRYQSIRRGKEFFQPDHRQLNMVGRAERTIPAPFVTRVRPVRSQHIGIPSAAGRSSGIRRPRRFLAVCGLRSAVQSFQSWRLRSRHTFSSGRDETSLLIMIRVLWHAWRRPLSEATLNRRLVLEIGS